MYKKLSGWLRFLWLRPQIKVFQMNDYDWVAARNQKQALYFYEALVNYDSQMIGELDIHRVSRAGMRSLRYNRDDDNGHWSFARQLNHCIIRGEKFPLYFASTEY